MIGQNLSCEGGCSRNIDFCLEGAGPSAPGVVPEIPLVEKECAEETSPVAASTAARDRSPPGQ